jgi:hypothetical protein
MIFTSLNFLIIAVVIIAAPSFSPIATTTLSASFKGKASYDNSFVESKAIACEILSLIRLIFSMFLSTPITSFHVSVKLMASDIPKFPKPNTIIFIFGTLVN